MNLMFLISRVLPDKVTVTYDNRLLEAILASQESGTNRELVRFNHLYILLPLIEKEPCFLKK